MDTSLVFPEDEKNINKAEQTAHEADLWDQRQRRVAKTKHSAKWENLLVGISDNSCANELLAHSLTMFGKEIPVDSKENG